MGFHVSKSAIIKIISGQYVDLGSLLVMQLGELDTLTLEFSQSGQIVVKPVQKTKMISNIETPSDAFLIYDPLFWLRIPTEILKYMNVVRLAAKQHPGLGWR